MIEKYVIPMASKEPRTEYMKRYRKEHPEKFKDAREKYKLGHPKWWDKYNSPEKSAVWKNEHPLADKSHKAKYTRKVKAVCFTHYGGKCNCCGESCMEFLTIDHINGGGTKHRKSLGIPTGFPFYIWLIKNNFPEGFQVLCYNCHMAKTYYGYCPHAK